jgi:hypothetical protein
MKPWQEQPLWWKLYMREDGVYAAAARIIGYLGCSPFEFYDAAKLLPNYDKYKFENAVRDLTVYTMREGPNPRYELHKTARKACRVIFGCPPEDPDYKRWWESRLISVRMMREAGEAVTHAAEPPVPFDPTPEPSKNGKAKPKKQAKPRTSRAKKK